MELFAGGNDIGTLALGLIMAGAVAGFASGALGAGAGLVLVPSLYLVLGPLGVAEELRMHVAAATALACILPVSLAMIAAGHARIDWAVMKRATIALFVGAGAGAALAAWLSGYLLTMCFIVLALVAAAFMALVKESWTPRAPRPLQRIAAVFDLGLVATLTGISLDGQALRLTGLATDNAAPVLSAGVAAIGAGVLIIAGWDLKGLPVHSLGYVNLMALAVAVLPMLGGALAGRHFADLVDAKRLRLTFAFFVTVIVAKMLWDLAG